MPFLVKSQESFEKSKENFSKRSGKIQEKFLSLTCGNPVTVSFIIHFLV